MSTGRGIAVANIESTKYNIDKDSWIVAKGKRSTVKGSSSGNKVLHECFVFDSDTRSSPKGLAFKLLGDGEKPAERGLPWVSPVNSSKMKSAPKASSAGKGQRYQTLKVLGRGAFGTAYLVRRKADSFTFVMKKLNLEQLGEKEKAEARNECAVMKALRAHPHIVKVVEHFEDDARLCIVMEHADGGDLAQRIEHQAIADGPFPEEQILDWFVQVCLALKHAHDRRILHRDLKPQNIFLTRKNFVRLGDFGISRVLSNTLSVASTCVGTPLYLAPELCEGKEYGSKSDVWSLGAILHELCALQPPFTANTMPALVMRICSDSPPALNANHCSQALRSLATSLLEKDPEKRPRVHDILELPLMKPRIEQFLDPEALIQEFSHTVIRSNSSGAPAAPAASSARPPSAPKFKSAKNTTQGAPSANGAAATKRAPSRGTVADAGATTGGRKPSPGLEPPHEEGSAQRAARLKADEDRRDAQREKMRQDRLAFKRTLKSGEPSPTAIVQEAVKTSSKDLLAALSAAQAVERPTLEEPPALETVVVVPPQIGGGGGAVLTGAGIGVGVGGAGGGVLGGGAGLGGGREVDDATRKALEAAHPDTRLLMEAERRAAHESLLKRQHEIVARVHASQLSGEARAQNSRESAQILACTPCAVPPLLTSPGCAWAGRARGAQRGAA